MVRMALFNFLLAIILGLATRSAWAEDQQQFDFVIIGGGTCGLAVANRLSELENVSVAVIEAGSDERKNPNVTVIENFGTAFGTPIDWGYKSVEQTHAGNRKIDYRAGKAIGGTSTINGMTYIRGEDVQIDAWEKIGNPGWNWEDAYQYYKKSEELRVPTPEQAAAGMTYTEEYHGFKGLLDVGYPVKLADGSFFDTVNSTWQNLGMPFVQDVNGGKVRGFGSWPMTVDYEANVREDAARAYYHPVEDRANLQLFKGVVTRIVWSDSRQEDTDAVAQGVEYISSDGTTQVIHASKEVIVSAGSLRSPAILEHSGVGNPRILERHGISVQVELPAVGENLQDQPNSPIIFQPKGEPSGKAPYAAFGTAKDLFGDSVTDVAASTKKKLGEWATLVSEASNNSTSAKSLEYLFGIQHDLIFKQNVPMFEMLTTAQSGLVVSVCWNLLPFARGNVHIGSADAQQQPLINPNFFLVDWDLTPQVGAVKLGRKFWNTEPGRAEVVSETQPGLEKVPEDASDEDWGAWLKSSFASNMHPVGTMAMMPRDLGGATDPKLKVYGTSNVRVVDASVVPFQISGHLTSTLYAISEKAADIIKAQHS